MAGHAEKRCCCTAILWTALVNYSTLMHFDDWIHVFLFKEPFLLLAANISNCILYVIRHRLLPLALTGKSYAQLQQVPKQLTSSIHEYAGTRGEKKPRKGGLGSKVFSVQSRGCLPCMSAASPACLLLCLLLLLVPPIPVLCIATESFLPLPWAFQLFQFTAASLISGCHRYSLGTEGKNTFRQSHLYFISLTSYFSLSVTV